RYLEVCMAIMFVR
ncbi:hypothetical protein ECEC1868_3328, partial [Escherichia coli EC1868]